jgi:hypothetical protein
VAGETGDLLDGDAACGHDADEGVAQSLGTQSSPRPAALVIWRNPRLMLCWSNIVPTVVVNTSPVSCHASHAVRRSAAWAALRWRRAATAICEVSRLRGLGAAACSVRTPDGDRPGP